MLQAKEIVVLVPGFMGFDKIGDFSYFSSRFVSGLSGAMMALRGSFVPVIPLTTLPTHSLADRQDKLFRLMQTVYALYPNVESIHVVGHSTGGVDGQLLLQDSPLPLTLHCDQWNHHPVRKKIKTVVGIAAPYWGTMLTTSAFVRFLEKPTENLDGLVPALQSAGHLLGFLLEDGMLRKALLGAATDSDTAVKYILQALLARDLMEDLRPEPMSELQSSFENAVEGAKIRSVVTMPAAYTTAKRKATGFSMQERREPDALFQLFFSLTAEGDQVPYPPSEEHMEQAIAAVKQATTEPGKFIKNEFAELRTVDAKLNDGIVNTARQLANPADPDELVALVVGDHLDVIGYFPQWYPASEPSDKLQWVQQREGILHSGSGFDEPQLHRMLYAIAGALS
ncbi:MAG: hypothetical protein EP343_26590 [Deltaproteobacteria bacterium]|nr:MAG: hypothetical protein EP343_26590 [Deltaproteobacteria bacterium]